MVRWGGDEGEANLGSEQCRRGGAARSERRGGRCEEGRRSHCRPKQYTVSSLGPDFNLCACVCAQAQLATSWLDSRVDGKAGVINLSIPLRIEAPDADTLETIEAAHNHLTNQSEHVLD